MAASEFREALTPSMEMENDSKSLTQNDDVEVVKWESMNSELLALIFLKISPSGDEIIRTVSLVCKGWSEVVEGSYCWTEVNLRRWCRKFKRRNYEKQYRVNFVVKKLLRRSTYTTRSFSGFCLGDRGFADLATCLLRSARGLHRALLSRSGRFLTVLKISGSVISDDIVEKRAGSLVNLKELDISYGESHLDVYHISETTANR